MTYITTIIIEHPDTYDGEEIDIEDAEHNLQHILEEFGAFDTRVAQAGIKVYGSVYHQ